MTRINSRTHPLAQCFRHNRPDQRLGGFPIANGKAAREQILNDQRAQLRIAIGRRFEAVMDRGLRLNQPMPAPSRK